jgi:solute carrier family 25 folate transporter 32
MKTTGVLTALGTNPLWVIKTRMLSTAANHNGAYLSTADGFRRVFRDEGMRGFYRGLTPSLFGVVHGALQFMAYEQMKQASFTRKTDKSANLGNYDFVILSATSKVFAGSVTYPYQVVRSRLQIYNVDEHYMGLRDAVGKIWTKEGLAGFYKGLGPNLLRVVPSTCVMFLVYENVRLHMSRWMS